MPEKPERDPLIETLGAAPHWQAAVMRARTLGRTDARATAWMNAFVERAHEIVMFFVPSTSRGSCPERFEIGPAGIAMPAELTHILRQALGREGPTLRALVFILVGAAVRSPLMPIGISAPWDTAQKLRILGRALPQARPEPSSTASTPVAGPTILVGHRLVAQAFGDPDRRLPAPPSLAPSAAIDLLMSAVTFRSCAELADAQRVARPTDAAA